MEMAPWIGDKSTKKQFDFQTDPSSHFEVAFPTLASVWETLVTRCDIAISKIDNGHGLTSPSRARPDF